MKFSVVITAVLFLPFCLAAQNLVPNCDLSSFTLCPTNDGQFDNAEYWYTPGEGTSDLCNLCNGGGNAGIPLNMWGFEEPWSGTGYGHIICYYPHNGPNYREYMEVELACPLEAGEDYRVSFFVSLSDNSRYAIDGLGLMFSENAVSQPGASVIDPGTNIIVSQVAGVPIPLKSGWFEITGIITAQGDEKFITIGNFLRDDETTLTEFPSLQTLYSSFYVGMVSVVPLQPKLSGLGADTSLCYGDSLVINAMIPCNANYLWEDGSVDPLRKITLPGTYSIDIQYGCSSFRDEINVSWDPKPITGFPADTVICPGSSILLNAGAGYANYLWQDGTIQSSLLADHSGIYWVEVTNGKGCSYRDTVNIESLVPPLLEFGDNRLLCPGDSIVLDAGNDNVNTRYLWNDNSTGRFLTIKQAGVYRVEVFNPCGIAMDTIEINFRSCEPAVFVPNAFTPDQDGVNDIFLASGVNISNFRILVFNRWGELLFESHNMAEGWDGRKAGVNCPPGVYVWVVYYESEAVEKPVLETLRGNLLLVR